MFDWLRGARADGLATLRRRVEALESAWEVEQAKITGALARLRIAERRLLDRATAEDVPQAPRPSVGGVRAGPGFLGRRG
jgi:hypothetical protein